MSTLAEKKRKLKDLLDQKFLDMQVELQRRDLTVEEFCERVNPRIKRQTMQNYLSGTRFPTGENLFLLGAVYPEVYEIAEFEIDEGISYIVKVWGDLERKDQKKILEQVDKYLVDK